MRIPVRSHDAHVATGEAVRQDVSRPQELGDLLDRGGPVADVNHERELHAIGQRPGDLERPDPYPSRRQAIDAGLDPKDDVAVGIHDFCGQVGIAIVDVRELPCGGNQAD